MEKKKKPVKKKVTSKPLPKVQEEPPMHDALPILIAGYESTKAYEDRVDVASKVLAALVAGKAQWPTSIFEEKSDELVLVSIKLADHLIKSIKALS